MDIYEKKYNEAMLRADEAVQKGCLDKNIFDIIFPPEESEDERIRVFLLDYAIEMIAGLESDISRSTYDGIKGHDPEAEAELAQWQKARAYLEKQKEQKPAEWSERDKKILASAMSHIADSQCFDHFHDVSKEDIYTWLKSLRPSWKPSEEQMYSLGTVVKGYDECAVGSVGYHLKEMYEQLKKLM